MFVCLCACRLNFSCCFLCDGSLFRSGYRVQTNMMTTLPSCPGAQIALAVQRYWWATSDAIWLRDEGATYPNIKGGPFKARSREWQGDTRQKKVNAKSGLHARSPGPSSRQPTHHRCLAPPSSLRRRTPGQGATSMRLVSMTPDKRDVALVADAAEINRKEDGTRGSSACPRA